MDQSKQIDELSSIDSCNIDNKEEFRRIRSAFLNIFEDVEESRRLAESEKNKTLRIVKNLTDGLIVLNQDNRIELVNPSILDILNKKESEVVGESIFDIVTEKIDLKIFLDAVRREDGQIKEVFKEEFCLGEKIYYEISLVSLREEEIEKGHLVLIRDISKEKLVDQMKTEFVSVAAHQLRTPLSAIKWTIRMILDGDTGDLNEEQRDFLGKTYESNERMIHLVNDLLNVTRIDEGRFVYKPEPMQLEDIVDEIIKQEETSISLKKIKVSWVLPPQLLPEVLVDKEKLEIAIQNLVENAIKYTKEGGDMIITIEEIDENILLKIKDSGVGIPKDQQSRIFTKFFRGENVIRLETEGSGLGLYTTKNIIEAQKGKIWFQSEEGEGTTFFITLPKISK
ncbi:MAG: ATP-binding protein [Candidatus Pacebacteria bacterium]|nr:ATP-binding protein [Candidatus Paceibacterota bacterium]